ncbi:hypothetical protein ACVI1K_001743 [Bradyrhizobium sp. USDA 4508]
MTGLAGHQKERPHRARRAHAQRVHRRLDELHGVVHRKPAGDHAAIGVDVEVDRLVGVVGFEEQQLRADQAGHRIIDLAVQEDDALAQEPGIDVEGTFAAARLFDDHRDELHHVAHRRPPLLQVMKSR